MRKNGVSNWGGSLVVCRHQKLAILDACNEASALGKMLNVPPEASGLTIPPAKFRCEADERQWLQNYVRLLFAGDLPKRCHCGHLATGLLTELTPELEQEIREAEEEMNDSLWGDS